MFYFIQNECSQIKGHSRLHTEAEKSDKDSDYWYVESLPKKDAPILIMCATVCDVSNHTSCSSTEQDGICNRTT